MPLNAAPKVVALLGVPGSGKSVVTRRLTDHHGFTRLRFSDPQRDMLAAGFGLTPEQLEGRDREKSIARFGGCSPYTLISTLSGKWGRGMIAPDLWIKEWQRRLTTLTGFVVTDDLQRPNEAEAVRAVGGIVVNVRRPGYIPPPGHSDFPTQAHVNSDLELVNYSPGDLTLVTDQFIAGLMEQLAVTE